LIVERCTPGIVIVVEEAALRQERIISLIVVVHKVPPTRIIAGV
jgi:hypothetical protein